jgi:hypothetical protein
MPLAEHNNMVKTIPPDRTDEPLRTSVLPWRPVARSVAFVASRRLRSVDAQSNERSGVRSRPATEARGGNAARSEIHTPVTSVSTINAAETVTIASLSQKDSFSASASTRSTCARSPATPSAINPSSSASRRFSISDRSRNRLDPGKPHVRFCAAACDETHVPTATKPTTDLYLKKTTQANLRVVISP